MITLVYKSQMNICETAGRALKEGKLVAFPTDTVYGLGAVFFRTDAVKRIFEAKGRNEGKPLSILVSDISQVEELAAEIPDEARILMESFWPGALTLIFKKSSLVPYEVTAGGETVGIRMSANEITRGIIKCAKAPIAAPSANLSGKRSAVCFEDVLEDLDGRIDMIIDGGRCSIGVSSTVVDISSGNGYRILREGTVTEQMIEHALFVMKNGHKIHGLNKTD